MHQNVKFIDCAILFICGNGMGGSSREAFRRDINRLDIINYSLWFLSLVIFLNFSSRDSFVTFKAEAASDGVRTAVHDSRCGFSS